MSFASGGRGPRFHQLLGNRVLGAQVAFGFGLPGDRRQDGAAVDEPEVFLVLLRVVRGPGNIPGSWGLSPCEGSPASSSADCAARATPGGSIAIGLDRMSKTCPPAHDLQFMKQPALVWNRLAVGFQEECPPSGLPVDAERQLDQVSKAVRMDS